MKNHVTTLEDAVGDIGAWTWWTDEGLPESFQVEFAWVQIWQQPKEPEQAPGNQVALRFIRPSCIAFLEFTDDGPPTGWPELLRSNEFPIQHISEQLFTLSSPKLASEILNQATSVEMVKGGRDSLRNIGSSSAFMAFRTGNVGMAIGAEELIPLTFTGRLSPKEIESAYRKWWQYWQHYWEVRDDAPLPRDPMCEVTIPAGGALSTRGRP